MLSSPPPAERVIASPAWPTALQHAALLLVITAGVSAAWLVARDEPMREPAANAALHIPGGFGVTSLASDAAAAPPQATGAFVAGLPIELAAASEVRSAFSLAVEAAAFRVTDGIVQQPTAAAAATAEAVAAAPLPSTAPSVAAAARATATPLAEPTPAVVQVTAPATAAPAVAAAPAAARHATLADLEAALARSRWPAELWPRVISVAGCESGTDTNRDGYKDIFDTHAIGSGGTTYGVMQVHRGHRFAVPLDLFALDDNLEAAYIVWERAGGSFAPWGCR